MLPGRPRSLTSRGAWADGTETILIAVPKLGIRDGMNSVRWLAPTMVLRWGIVTRCPSSALPVECFEEERSANTLAMSVMSSSGVNF